MPEQRLKCACAKYTKRWAGKGAVNCLLRCRAWACKESAGISAVSVDQSGVNLPHGQEATDSHSQDSTQSLPEES